MPGPGGGSHGGGGFRGGGGSFGGGNRGGFSGGHRGGFSGGHHTPPPHHGGGFHGPHFGGNRHHRPHFGGGWYRRPNYNGGGGCFGSISALLIIVILILFFVGNSFLPSNITINDGNSSAVNYDENKFQDFADSQYRNEFGDTDTYEDNILLVFLTEDDTYYDYYYIAWVGDHIATEINFMFGNENTQFGQAVAKNINSSSYKYSLDSNIAQIVREMKNNITANGFESSFICNEKRADFSSHITNKTTIDITIETVNTELQSFTEETRIPIVVVVEDADEVFVNNTVNQTTNVFSGSRYVIFIIIGVAAVILIIAITVSVSKKRKKELESDN